MTSRQIFWFFLVVVATGAFKPVEHQPTSADQAILGQFCGGASECSAPMSCVSWTTSQGGCQGSKSYRTCEIPCATNADCPVYYSCSELRPTWGQRTGFCRSTTPKDGALHLMECDKFGCREGECVSWEAPVRSGFSCSSHSEKVYSCELRCEPERTVCPGKMECIYLSPGPGWHCRTREDYTPIKDLEFE